MSKEISRESTKGDDRESFNNDDNGLTYYFKTILLAFWILMMIVFGVSLHFMKAYLVKVLETEPEKAVKAAGIIFVIVFAVAALLVFGAFRVLARYWNRHVFNPIYKIISATNESVDRPLPETGEGYFDNLVRHINDWIAEEKERERIENNLLKKQIDAHFTVNTLNALRALINKDDKKSASDMCEELSALLRYAGSGETYISLFEEFFVLSQYVSIMKTRNPGRLDADLEYDDSYEEIRIPRMIIQPIVENAIVHGIGSGKGTVRVYAETGDDLRIMVEDDGKGMSEEALDALRAKIAGPKDVLGEELKHIALANVQKRIDILYGKGYGLDITSKEGSGTCVTVRLPLMN